MRSSIAMDPSSSGGTPKPSRFPIHVLPTASGNASAVPSNVAYWGKAENMCSI
jgi:hypothetical protein